jgi:hypothetical protein
MTQMPSTVRADDHYGLPTTGMAPGLALLFNDRLYERCKDVARIMAEARGFTPPHLIGNQHACFGVVQMSITWRLTPQLVAASTYATPGGKIGYEGKLIQAILENSGRIEGNIEYELIGDWNKVRGKHKKATSSKGHEYFVPGWKDEDEEGLGVIVRAKVRGEEKAREMEPFMLRSCHPRNSTLWATRPEQQIKYTACRAFANTVAPGILMGVPFDTDFDQGNMIDVTPQRPNRSDFETKPSMDREASTAASPETLVGRNMPGEAGSPAEERVTQPDASGPLHPDENPMPEFGPADAMEMGRVARQKGAQRKAIPGEWRDGTPEHDGWIEAWQAGWDQKDEETKAKIHA